MSSDTSILHVDLDAFYASVEQRDDPTLRGRPVIVGGLGPRGVVAAASYEARRYGVHSATPMTRARRACPDGVFLAPRFDVYRRVSDDVMNILRSYTPLVEPIALDEAFLDVSGARRLHGSGRDVAIAIRTRVSCETGLTISVGAATTKLVAKLASDLAKPDGMLVIEPGTELAFLHPLEMRRLWGVGPKTARRLAGLGVNTIGDLARVPEDALVAALGNAAGRSLHARAWNRDDRAVTPDHEVKSIGHEETFPVDVHDRDSLQLEITRLADRVASRLRAADRAARTVQLKLRYGDFRTITRSRTLEVPTAVGANIAATARELLDSVPVAAGVRLLGISGQQLQVVERSAEGDTDQSTLFDAKSGKWEAAERSIDAVRARFGAGAVGPGVPQRGRREQSKPPTR